jgi:glycyl-tRNA synthetase beta chain
MSYQLEDGKTTVQFVRPVKKLVALYGERIVPVSLFGLQAGRLTNGHRFHTHMPIEIRSADEYSQQMVATGKVIPSYKARRACMVEQLEAAAKKLNAEIIMPQDLVDEVAALTEWPVVYESGFDEEFLSVPEECLILTMQQNQKYFALRDQNHKLINRFLLVSHIVAKDGGEAIKSGNARVVRARLADAKFFYDQDRMQTLESRVPGLEHVVYHNKLGTQLQRSLRVQAMARRIAEKIGADPKLAERAAKLAKADLRTLMVGEFPELQGIMGEYYARNDKEDPLVCLAIREHYQPRFSGDALPSTPVSLAVALADKIETLAGLFGIGQIPTGDKDPYALRRHALGILRMIRELRLPLSLTELIDIAMEEESTVEGVKDVRSELKAFFKDRLRVMLRDEGYSALEVEAVLAAEPKELNEVKDRLEAVRAFAALPEAQSLAAANKRIENILKKNELPLNGTISEDLLEAEEEKALYRALEEVKPKVAARMKNAEYTAALSEVAPLKLPVDNFFESVMVNSENEALRRNRLELLRSLHNEMNRVARLSVLAG